MNGNAERHDSFRSPRPWKHSENQYAAKHGRDMRQKTFGRIDKAVKAEVKREKKRQLLEDEQLGMKFLPKLIKMETERILWHVFDGGAATLEEIDFIDRQGEATKRFTIPEGVEDPEVIEELPEVIVTIVYFTPPRIS